MIEAYETMQPSFEFASRAFDDLERMHQNSFNTRNDPGVKEFIEEVVPLAVFAKSIEAPETRVRVQFVGRNNNYDGKLHVSGAAVTLGGVKSEYFVEITSAVSPREYLQREALATLGYSWAGKGVKRVGKGANKTVEATPVSRDREGPVNDAIRWMREAIAQKNAKDYPLPCILLIRLVPDFIPSAADWIRVVSESRTCAEESRFTAVAVVDTLKGNCRFLSAT